MSHLRPTCWLRALSVILFGGLLISPLSAQSTTGDDVPTKPAATIGDAAPSEAGKPPQPAGPPTLSLTIGHPAPPLMIEEWYTGTPVEKLASGKVYVVEFWATWCGPCLASMPHLSELQASYGDKVQVIGITREDAETVTKFLGREQSPNRLWREVISYRLARDKDSMMSQSYMRAAGQSGIPTSFIVGPEGIIEWIGHPMRMDKPLARVLSGNWDRAEALAMFERDQKLKLLSRQVSRLVSEQSWDEALATLDDMRKLTDEDMHQGIRRMRLTVLQRAGRAADAAKLFQEMAESAWDDAQELNALAWSTTLARGERDLAAARKLARRAVELTNSKDAAILDTLARIHFELGDLDQAIEWQSKAVDVMPEHSGFQRTLKRYQQALADRTKATPEASAETEKVAP